jgi:rhomboid family GlyGly-CTERM serine protease
MFTNPLAYVSHNWFLHPWTLWTAPLVHLSLEHAVANVLALAVLVGIAFFTANRTGRTGVFLRSFGLGLMLVWPLSTLSLVLCPQVTSYVGLSGVVHGAAALLGVLLIRSSWMSWVLLAGLAVKLYLEQAWIQPVVWSADWGFNVVVVAHLYGAGVGLIVGFVVGAVLVAPTAVGEMSRRDKGVTG